MNTLFINASPRKNFNTARLLKKAMEGAEAAGAHTELANLYDYEFTGCRSCFACKIKGSKTGGVCAIRDSVRPLLEKAHAADALVFGSPVYYGYPAGQLRSFIERFLFPIDTYLVDDTGARVKVLNKTVPTGIIFTMNVPDFLFDKVQYPTLLGFTGKELERLCGYNECLYVKDTYQFADYSRYDVNMFSEEKKRERREEQFPLDLQNAYDLGARLAEKARELHGGAQ